MIFLNLEVIIYVIYIEYIAFSSIYYNSIYQRYFGHKHFFLKFCFLKLCRLFNIYETTQYPLKCLISLNCIYYIM